MIRRTCTCAVSAIALSIVVLSVGGATGSAHASQSGSCSSAPPAVLPEPSFTRGESNTIRWEHVAESCWINDDALGDDSTQRRFTVIIRNPATRQDRVGHGQRRG